MASHAKLSQFNVFTLILLVSLSSVGAIALSSALPTITQDFKISKESSQHFISLYMLGFAIGPLFYGPLSNRYGRKPLMLISISIFALGALCCYASAFFHSFFLMAFSRLTMALMGGGCLKMCWNMAADVFQGSALTKISSYFVLSFSLAPPFSIAIGGFLTENYGWPSIFLFLILYSALLLFFSYLLPRTLRQEAKEPLILKQILARYSQAFRNPLLVFGSTILGTASASVYLFGTEAPFISQNTIGLSPEIFGSFAMLTNLGMFIGGISSAKLATRWKSFSIFGLGLVIFIGSALLMVGLFAASIITIWTLFLPVALIFLGSTLVYCSAAGLALSHVEDRSYATSVMNFLNLGMSFVFVWILGHLPTTSSLVLPLLLLVLSLIAGILGWALKRSSERLA